MKPAERTFILLILSVLAVAAAVGAYLLLGDGEPEEEEQREAARERDGAAAYDMVFEFESRHSGYGDREGEILAQVITPHKLEARVEKASDSGGWEVSSAVTDGVFDEKEGEFLEEAEEGKTSRVD